MASATAAKMSEKQLQDAVVELAKLLGWRVMHQRPARRSDGSWRTAIQGHAGFPDLVLCRPPRLVFAELKVGKNRLSHDQGLWLNSLKACTSVEAYDFRELDWVTGVVEGILQ